mmetsp:Transcript_25721/g.45138  ORF Transcript_25721/g.45138 Transcript_25721/m.45138 type:complete len:203 (-) Transcript_25721:483-1091(-)
MSVLFLAAAAAQPRLEVPEPPDSFQDNEVQEDETVDEVDRRQLVAVVEIPSIRNFNKGRNHEGVPQDEVNAPEHLQLVRGDRLLSHVPREQAEDSLAEHKRHYRETHTGVVEFVFVTLEVDVSPFVFVESKGDRNKCQQNGERPQNKMNPVPYPNPFEVPGYHNRHWNQESPGERHNFAMLIVVVVVVIVSYLQIQSRLSSR